MKITISFFASLSDVFGHQKIENIQQSTTIDDLVKMLKVQKPESIDVFDASRYAVNDVFVEKKYTLKNDDHLVILPPSSGG